MLDLLIGEPRGRAHETAHEAVLDQPALAVDGEVDCHAGALDRGPERAELVGKRLRQHRHDAVGEIDGVAAALGGTVERATGSHVPADVRDGHDRMPEARALGVRLRENRVVEIAGVGSVDGDQRDLTQVRAPLEPHGPSGLGFRDCRLREFDGNAVVGDRDQADRAWMRAVANALDDARLEQAEASPRHRLAEHDFAVLGALGVR